MTTDGTQVPGVSAGDVPLQPHPLLESYHADEAERRRQLVAWFDESAVDYDWINQALDFGAGSWYRRQALLRAGLGPGMRVLDVASGTGVLAAHAQKIVGPSGRVAALDPSLGMLRQAVGRGVRRPLRGIAEALPFRDGGFDLVSMGFALRHVADLRATFGEYRRMLRPGGRALILEITPPRAAVPSFLLELYLGRLVPLVARFGRRGRTSRRLMQYYWDTIAACVPPEVIVSCLEQAGFASVERRVELGILSEYVAVR